MIVQSTYFAKEGKYSDIIKKQIITYFFYAGEEKFSKSAATGGLLNKIYSLDEDNIFRLSRSPKEKDRKKLNDYNVIKYTLKSLAKQITEQCKKNGVELYIQNSNNEEGHEGCRKLKDFEEKLLLAALRGE